MTSVWDDPEFVAKWNDTYGLDMRNAPIRPSLIFPLLAQKIGQAKGLSFVDLGCGNGNLILAFQQTAFGSWVGIDAGKAVVESAQKSVIDPRIRFVHGDVSAPLAITKDSVDAVFSIFVIEELPLQKLSGFFSNISRMLKNDGRAYLFTNHPVNAFHQDMEFLRRSEENQKFEGHKGYFDREPTTYALSVMNQQGGHTQKADYHHKTTGDIVNGISQAGLTIHEMQEIPQGVISLDAFQKHKPQRGDVPRFLYLELGRR